MSHRILLVDDEIDILEFVSYNLGKAGYEVFTAQNGKDALSMAMEHRPHLILLDMMMPIMDGVQTCQSLRLQPELKETMIVFLSALGDEPHQIAGFEVGADDYITKPIKMNILMSRIQAILKRIDQDEVQIAPLIDQERHVVRIGSTEITLPRKEFALLTLLQANPGKLLSREEIYTQVWGHRVVVGDRTIDVHIRKLRQKIGESHITTVKGIGYKYEV
ncbi:MAG: response regulator transcription factor [Alistipes sp.]